MSRGGLGTSFRGRRVTDAPRQFDRPLGERVSVVEAEMTSIGHRLDDRARVSDKLHDEILALVRKLDDRADRQDLNQARLIGAVGVLILIGQVISPTIAQVLGLVPG